ncbi:ABC transporter G family member 31 [Phytophthora cinnamomi]|uniref:ABC transporter G family member 31 n=1 Tax=Phytophthora cinnamomi TaxID=4785 RepID=UPI00355A24D0|nr:ABC transporter G family member 31 [Phytophthora cinnamomi]
MVMSPNQGGLGSHRVDTVRFLRFDGKNFLVYKEGLKAALKARKCWKILVGEETKPERDGSQEAARRRKKWKTKVLLLNVILTNTLDDGTRVRLAHLEKPQAKWSALVEDFEKKSFAVALFKRRELLNVEFDGDNESIRDYIHRVEAIRQELTLMGENVSDREGEHIEVAGMLMHPSYSDFMILELEKPSSYAPVQLAATDDSDIKVGE